MTKGDYMKMIEADARDYIAQDVIRSILRNSHMNDLKVDEAVQVLAKVPKEFMKNLTEAIIVDFINFLGYKQGLDYGMYTYDLKGERNINKETGEQT